MTSTNYDKYMALLKQRQEQRNQDESNNNNGIKVQNNNGASHYNTFNGSAANSNFMSNSKNIGDIRFDMS